MRPWFDFLFWCYIYSVWLFILYASPPIFFSSFFPYSSPPLLIFSLENRRAPFPGRMSRKVTKLALLFCVYFSFDRRMRAFVVLGLVFSTPSQRLVGGNAPKRPILCRVGRKTTTQSTSCVVQWCNRFSAELTIKRPQVWLAVGARLHNHSGQVVHTLVSPTPTEIWHGKFDRTEISDIVDSNRPFCAISGTADKRQNSPPLLWISTWRLCLLSADRLTADNNNYVKVSSE